MAKRNAVASECQQRNYCLFILKGQVGHRPFLQPHVSPALLDKLRAVQEEVIQELHQSILNHKQEHHNGTS